MDPIVIHSFPTWLPQTQTWMYNQVNELQKLGVNTHVACETTENLGQFFVPNMHCLENSQIIQKILGICVRKFKVSRYSNHLSNVCMETNANIIHSHFGHVGWTNIGVAQSLKLKHVVTFYGYDVNKLPVQHPVWKKRYKQLFSKVDRVLCEGSHMADCVVNLGCPRGKVKVQHLGVNVDNITYRTRKWKIGEPLKVLIAASFREKKGIPNAIRALEIIARKEQIQLTVIGDAGKGLMSRIEKRRILATLKSSGLYRNTKLLGYQPHDSMMNEAYKHHLFLQPSITAKNGDTEGGAPVSIIEMLATGMPVVATTHCDIPEVMGPSMSHLLANEQDVVGLANCIQALLDNPNSWNEATNFARSHIEHNYNQVTQAKNLHNHYVDVL